MDPEIAREGLRRLRPLRRLAASLTPDPSSDVARVCVLESAQYMRNQLLRDADWAGMAHSLEIRVPLVDFTLLRALAPVIPVLTPGAGKAALANAPTLPLPDEIVTRAKTGFSVPTGDWMNAAIGRGSDPVGRAPEPKGLVSRRWSRAVLNGMSTGQRATAIARVMNPSPTMLALVTDAFGGRGGIAQYNRDFLGALAETGAVSSITVLPRQAPDLFVLPERIEQTPARPGRIGYSVAALRTALLRPVDLVFCGHLFMAPLAALIARLKRAKLIVQTHGIEAWSRPSKAQRAALEAADLVLCVSRHTRAAVLSWAAIAPERVLVVPNTVREVFTPADGSTQRAALGLEGKRVLLTVGRMDSRERYKGHDRVIAAIPDLVAKGHDICYVVVGEGRRSRPPRDPCPGCWGERPCAFPRCRRAAKSYRDLPHGRPVRHAVNRRRFWRRIPGGDGERYAGAWPRNRRRQGCASGRRVGNIAPQKPNCPSRSRASCTWRSPIRSTLASAVRARFGREKFVAAVHRF